MKVILFIVIAIYFMTGSDGHPNPLERAEEAKRSIGDFDDVSIGSDRK